MYPRLGPRGGSTPSPDQKPPTKRYQNQLPPSFHHSQAQKILKETDPPKPLCSSARKTAVLFISPDFRRRRRRSSLTAWWVMASRRSILRVQGTATARFWTSRNNHTPFNYQAAHLPPAPVPPLGKAPPPAQCRRHFQPTPTILDDFCGISRKTYGPAGPFFLWTPPGPRVTPARKNVSPSPYRPLSTQPSSSSGNSGSLQVRLWAPRPPTWHTRAD